MLKYPSKDYAVKEFEKINATLDNIVSEIKTKLKSIINSFTSFAYGLSSNEPIVIVDFGLDKETSPVEERIDVTFRYKEVEVIYRCINPDIGASVVKVYIPYKHPLRDPSDTQFKVTDIEVTNLITPEQMQQILNDIQILMQRVAIEESIFTVQEELSNILIPIQKALETI